VTPGEPVRSQSASEDPDVSEIARRLHLATIHLLRRLRKEDESLGFSASQLSAITTLVRLGPTSVGDLAQAEGVRPPTMTRLVQRLERQGIVIRKGSPHDGRVSQIRHTTKAIKLLEEGKGARERALGEGLRGLSHEELGTLDQSVEIIERLAGVSKPPRS